MDSQFLKEFSPGLLICRLLTFFRLAMQFTAMTFPCSLVSLMLCWSLIIKSVNNDMRLQRCLIKRVEINNDWARHLRHRIHSPFQTSRIASFLNSNWASGTSSGLGQWLRRIWGNFLNLILLPTILLNRMLCAWSSSINQNASSSCLQLKERQHFICCLLFFQKLRWL